MSRPQPYIPPGTTVETTTRTLCGMFLFPATRYFADPFADLGGTLRGGPFTMAEESESRFIYFGSRDTKGTIIPHRLFNGLERGFFRFAVLITTGNGTFSVLGRSSLFRRLCQAGELLLSAKKGPGNRQSRCSA